MMKLILFHFCRVVPRSRVVCLLSCWMKMFYGIAKKEGRFPEPKEIKQKIRDFLCPSRDLGHSDVKKEEENNSNEEEMDDDEAAEMRKFFGVS
mmetsp:Transcript_13637/g.19874  ORF Transcript_13637/g.19874 Transcript_13637/m.19874 type:complete len:93 (-) Transcript_13637:525-803(-)